jgi:hypothetical protein
MRISKMRGVASVLALSIGASTAGAAELTPGPSLWTAAQDAGARTPALAQTTAAPATANPRTDSSFFKTTAGKVTLGLMAVGLGLTIYSFSNDRKPVKSPIR